MAGSGFVEDIKRFTVYSVKKCIQEDIWKKSIVYWGRREGGERLLLHWQRRITEAVRSMSSMLHVVPSG
jgi:hypothetical protein